MQPGGINFMEEFQEREGDRLDSSLNSIRNGRSRAKDRYNNENSVEENSIGGMREGRFPTFENRSGGKKPDQIIYNDDDLEEDPDILISTIRTHGRLVTTEVEQVDFRAKNETFMKANKSRKVGCCDKIRMIGALCKRPLALDSDQLEEQEPENP